MAKHIQLQNFSLGEEEEEELEGFRPLSDRVFYTVTFLAVFGLFSITYPYQQVRIPGAVLMVGATLGMVGLLAASWLRPEQYWATLAFTIYIPFSGKYAGSFNNVLTGFNMTNALLLPILLQWIVQRSRLGQPLLRFHPPDLPILIFCVLSSISVLRVGIEQGNADFSEQFIRIKRWLMPFAVYLLFVNTARNERGVRQLVIALGMAVAAIAILTMKESYDIGPASSWDRVRVKGVLNQANATGAFFVYYSLIFLGFFFFYWRERRYWLLLIPFLLCGRAMTLANSRGGMIAFTLALLALLWYRSKRLFVCGVMAVSLAAIFPQFLPETISGRLIYGTLQPMAHAVSVSQQSSQVGDIAVESTTSPWLAGMDSSSLGRLAIWQAGWRMFLDHPWFGMGYGEFPLRVGDYEPALGLRDPHNAYLGIAVEMGGVALVAFLGILAMLLRSCIHVYHNARDDFMRSVGLAGVAMMAGVICANAFGSRFDTVELTAYFWILAAIIVQYDTDLRAHQRALARSADRIVVDPWKQEEEEEEEELPFAKP